MATLLVSSCSSTGKGINPLKVFATAPDPEETSSPVDFAYGTVDTINSIDMNDITETDGIWKNPIDRVRKILLFVINNSAYCVHPYFCP